MATIDSVKLPDNSTYDLTDNYSGYQTETLATPITINGTQETTVEGALGAINAYVDDVKEDTEGELSHENLLDNPWFTVNQRGATGGTIVANTPIVDRWKIDLGSGSPTWALTSSGITLNPDASSYAYIYQQLADGSVLNGKQLTVSVKLSDGTVLSTSFTRASATNQFETKDNVRMGINASDRVAIYAMDGASKTIRAVKLEVGSVSTLHLDVAPDYTTELLRCQRYYYVLEGDENTLVGMGFSSTESYALIAVKYPVTMRSANVTLTNLGSFSIRESGINHAVSALSLSNKTKQQCIVIVTTTGLTAHTPCYMTGTTSWEIGFSADL